MGICDNCGHKVIGVASSRMEEGKMKHYCETCIIPIKEREQKFQKQQQEALELGKKLKEEATAALHEKRKQDRIEIQKRQKEIFGETLIDQYEDDYREALKAIDAEVGDLIANGKEMKSIFLFNEKLQVILNVHEALHNLYEIIYNNKDLLTHFNSERVRQVGYELKATTKMLQDAAVEQEFMEDYVVNELKKIGFHKTHWYIKESKLTEIEYMIETLRILIEPDFIPLESTDKSKESQHTDRYVPSPIKISVWRRDQGKCVECGTREKLEYDHIIPVSKGGSNTERNVQLLCEKCNRQKSATIQ